MPMSALWFVLLVIFAIVEAATVGLASIWFAAGALVAMLAAFFHAPLWLQVVLFLAVSFVTLLLARPLARRFLTPSYQATNADRILGQEAVVTETIDNLHGRGLVSVGGSVWTARAQTDQPITAGTVVKVLRIEGVKVFVTPAEVSSAVR
jgi:membrane protein implicated in regulation of membrane protease activity